MSDGGLWTAVITVATIGLLPSANSSKFNQETDTIQ